MIKGTSDIDEMVKELETLSEKTKGRLWPINMQPRVIKYLY